MKSLKKRLFLVISISVSLLFGTFGAVFFSNSFKTIYADDKDHILEVAKVTLYQKENDNTNLYYKVGNEFKIASLEVDLENTEDPAPFGLENYEVIQQMEEDDTDNVFMLNNANSTIETSEINNQTVRYTSKQFLLVRFLPYRENNDQLYTFINLSVNATLSGSHHSSQTVNISTLEKTSSAQTDIYYAKLFDLENTYLLDTSAQDGIGEHLNEYDAQGKYTFSFTYNIRDKQGRVQTNINKTTEFYLLSENYYINPNSTPADPRSNVDSQESIIANYVKTSDSSRNPSKTYYIFEDPDFVRYDEPFENGVVYYEQFTYNSVYNNNYGTNNIYTEPRLFNTERIDRLHFGAKQQLEQNYFTYSNQFTVDYNGNKNNTGEYLYYPTLKYDATKYNFTYTKVKAGVTYTTTSSLDTTGAYPKLVLTEKNSLGNITKVEEITDVVAYNYQFDEKTYTGYIVTLNFVDVGKYILEFHYVINDYAILSNTDKLLNIEQQNWNKIGSNQLTIFGYQLEHSDYKNISGSTEKETKFVSYEQITDLAVDFDPFNTYQYNEANDIYYSTLDTDFVYKNYYKPEQIDKDNVEFNENNTFEFDGENYVLTQDTEYDANKDYYRFVSIDVLNDVFDASITYEYSRQNGLYLTQDTKYETKTTYYKRNLLFADVTNKNIDNDGKILGQKINDSEKSGALIDSIEESLTAGFTQITYNDDKVIKVNKIPYTNQAPLFFSYFAEMQGVNSQNYFYYHYSKTGNEYYIDKQNNQIVKYPLNGNSNVRFTDNGLYVVVVSYDMPDYQIYKAFEGIETTNAHKHTKVQIFVFEIANIEPNVEISPYENENPVEFGPRGYTNNSVKIDWSKAIESPFDVTPQIKVFKQEFGENQQSQDITSNLNREQFEQGYAIIENNGIYSVRIDYGPCTPQLDGTYLYSASITTTFIVDKEAIQNIEFFEITNNYTSLTQNMTNKNFALAVGHQKDAKDENNNVIGIVGDGKKNSNARISVTYTFMPINSGIDQEELAPVDDNEKYIANNKSITQINQNITYNQNNITDKLTSANENVLSNDGIYIFTFTDEAGNTTTRYLLKDTTKPVVLQKVEGDNTDYTIVPASSANQDNIVNKNTKLIWGTHKAIKLAPEIYEEDNDTFNLASENAFGNEIFSKDGKSFILVENNTTYASTKNNIYENDVLTQENIAICFKNKTGKYEKLNSTYAIQNPENYTILATTVIVDEKITHPTENLYRFAVSDKLGNRFNGLVEMSFDNSALQAHVIGTPKNNVQIIGAGDDSGFDTNGDGAKQRLYEKSVSNKKTLSFSWIAGEGEFEVVSVVANFYPLTYETSSLNYPYASTPQQFNLMEHTTTETVNGVTRTKSAEINLVQDERYGEQATVQGYYEVVRTYANGDEPKHYDFFIDRNNIISYEESFTENNKYIGDDIAIELGDITNKYSFAGSEFLQEFITEYVLSTNKQPANIAKPDYKYSYDLRDANGTYLGQHMLFGEFVDENGNVIKGSLNKSGLYTIKIWDNSYDEGLEPEYCTSVQFKVLIDLYKPVANFVDEDSQIMTVSNQNSNLSTNSTKVKLNWEKIGQNDRMAKIDEENIKIEKVTESGNRTIIYQIVNGTVTVNPARISAGELVKTDGEEKYIDLDMFSSLIKENCKIEITLKYQTGEDASYGNYLSSTKVIYFDFEKPNTNYYRLLDNDKYLPADIKASARNPQNENSFDNYNAEINFENYAFVIPSTYRFSTPPASQFWQAGIDGSTSNPNDVQTVWYRKYNKYADQQGINAQSIVPGDDRYDDMTKAPTRYRFNPNTKINGEWLYTQINTSLENFDWSLLTSDSYYEIIEMDCAGNYRIYTIYIPEIDQAQIDYQIRYNDTDSVDYLTPSNYSITNSYEINSQKLDILNVQRLGEWFNISVYDGSTDKLIDSVIKIAPEEIDGYVSKNVGLNLVNGIIKDDEKIGKYFIISIQSPLFEPIIINFHTPGIGFKLDFNLSTVLTVTIDQNKYDKVTYLKTFKVYEDKTNDDGTITQELLDKDNNNKTIKENYTLEDNIVTYTFTYSVQKPKSLWFEYSDNFGVVQKVPQILGIEQTPFDEMLTFNNTYIKNESYKPDDLPADNEERNYYVYAEYYTSSTQVVMEYQPLLFPTSQIHMTRNNKNYDFETDSNGNNTNSNTKRIEIFSLDDEIGTDNVYLIKFVDTAEPNYHYTFSIHHYTKLTELKFVDSSGYSHYFDETDDETYESSVSRVVYLQFDKIDTSVSYPIETTVRITRTYYDSNNVKLVQDYGYVNGQFEFKDYGIYNITAKNSLGTSKTYHFELIKSEATYYSVKVNINGRTVLLTPSEEKLNKGDVQYEHYLSIYNAIIDVNQERNLKVVAEDAPDDAVTKYYKISSINDTFNYEKYIAITKIPVSSNILGNGMYLNEQKITGSNRYLKTNEKSVVLTIPAYSIPDNDTDGANKANKLKVRVVYGSTDLGYVQGVVDNNNLNIEFTSAGTYYIYISDFAGNSHSFGGTAFYTLSLVNNFVYKLNEEIGIYNSIFNDSVNLSVIQTENFVRDNNGSRFTITATLNGNSYTPTFVNGNYLFNSYGTYFVTLKGYINDNTQEENLVQTDIKFSILNPNEAKLMHEYIGLNGYEVVKIEKNGNDITDLIKEQLGIGTINQFAIFGGQDGVGGNGNYVITVSALIDKIIGEREFKYSVWINKDTEILILCDLPEGDSTTKDIHLTMNLYQIYSKVGECKIKINGEEFITVNSASASNNSISTYTLRPYRRYNITLETNSGNTIMSFVVTKVEPLNSVAIIIIVISSVVVAGLVVTFIILRKRMRVK